MGAAMTTTERHPIPPIVCEPWCEDGGGHTTAAFRGDQTCWRPSNYVDQLLGEVTRDSYGVYVPQIGVMAYRRRPTQAPRLVRRPSIHMTCRSAPDHRFLVVLGDVAQTTAGKWITHPPSRCPTATASAPEFATRCRSRTVAGVPGPGRFCVNGSPAATVF